MTEHLTQQEVNLFRDRSLGPTGRQRVDAHVAGCESCLRLILPSEDVALAYSEVVEALLTGRSEEPFHLSDEELERYAGETVDEADRVIFESHLEICDRCREAFESLLASPAFYNSGITSSTTQSDIAPSGFFAGWHPGVLISNPRVIAAALITLCLLVGFAVWQTRQLKTGNETDRERAVASPPIPQSSVSPKPPETVANVDSPGGDQPGTIASLKDNGREIGLDQTGKLVGLEELPETTRSIVRAALTTKNLDKPEVLDKLTAPSITLLDPSAGGESFKLIGPSQRVIVSNHPTLRWQPLKGATSYTVSVFDADFNRVARSNAQTATQWTTPALPRGMIYLWEVVATRNGQEVRSSVAQAPRAQFKILEADKLNTLSKLKQQHPVSHLARGLMYARHGLISDAEGEFRQLVKENPDSALARKLLRTVQSWSR